MGLRGERDCSGSLGINGDNGTDNKILIDWGALIGSYCIQHVIWINVKKPPFKKKSLISIY